MRMARIATSALVLALAVGAGLGLDPRGFVPPAAATAPAATIPQVSLTAAMIRTFITSYPTVRPQMVMVGAKYKVAANTANPDQGLSAWASVPQAWTELNAVVAPFGYANFKAYLDVTLSITVAYMFSKPGSQMAASLAQIQTLQNNPQIPAAQKQAILAGLGVLVAMAPSQQNLDTVRPFMAELAPLLN